MPTIGVDFKIKTLTVDGQTVKLQIWLVYTYTCLNSTRLCWPHLTVFWQPTHPQGHSRPRANGIILIYDITSERSFQSVSSWLQEVNRYLGHKSDVRKLLIGNKADLEHERQVSTEQGKAFAEANGLPFLEASAKKDINVEQMFRSLAEAAVRRSSSTMPRLEPAARTDVVRLQAGDAATHQTGPAHHLMDHQDQRQQQQHQQQQQQREELKEGGNVPASLLLHTGNVLQVLPALAPHASPRTELLRMCEVALYRSQQGALEDRRAFAIGAQHQDVKLTVKLFLGEGAGASQAQAQVREAVAALLRHLEVEFVDTLLLAPPPSFTSSSSSSSSLLRVSPEAAVDELLLPAWRALEELVADGRLRTLGTCGLQQAALAHLHALATVKPRTNQIYTNELTTETRTLLAFAKSHHMSLLALPEDAHLSVGDINVDSLRAKYPSSLGKDGHWRVDWLARYCGAYKCRTALARKGYFVQCRNQK
ncbi:Ras subfamily protein [Acanthamoeba castellanii str. Neff]|uniref:Ras subfamily protein n=1 Tax=Acanthamoeba castellanii (strain ATCC 30010 / Neff) TaxID=1257118 RepID=L8GNA1_ACACF|nr:Ras subfamily protein [Acanthamoeba castellanii str. Neff]ELR14462.1 Ras subfamily protein [Acanthamoeba castellanii str. Neff]